MFPLSLHDDKPWTQKASRHHQKEDPPLPTVRACDLYFEGRPHTTHFIAQPIQAVNPRGLVRGRGMEPRWRGSRQYPPVPGDYENLPGRCGSNSGLQEFAPAPCEYHCTMEKVDGFVFVVFVAHVPNPKLLIYRLLFWPKPTRYMSIPAITIRLQSDCRQWCRQ